MTGSLPNRPWSCNRLKRRTILGLWQLFSTKGFGQFHLLAFRGIQVRAEAGAATCLVHSGGAYDDQFAACAKALGVDGRGSADDAYGGELGHLVGDGHERGNRAEGVTGKGGVEAGQQDALSQVDEFADQLHNRLVEELRLVDADDFHVGKLLVQSLAEVSHIRDGHSFVDRKSTPSEL